LGDTVYTRWVVPWFIAAQIPAFGVAVQMLGKLWFLDRMALLYDEFVTF
jgi:hypothetical protein